MRKPGGRDHRSFVLYGRSGTGKTTLACDFPKPALLFNVKDDGDDSVSDIEGLDVVDVKDWDSFELYYWYLLKHPSKYKTLIIDTVSQLQQLAILKVQEKRGIDPSKPVKGRKVSGGAGDFGAMTRQAWGDVAALMKTWITNVRDLPLDSVFIAQDRVFNREDEGEDSLLDPTVGPALSPSIATHLNAAVHVIANTFIRTHRAKIKTSKGTIKEGPERLQFCARIGPNPVYITKVRKPRAMVPPSVLINPTYQSIIQLVRGTTP